MAGQLTKISVLLNGGVDEQSLDELGGPVAQQGASLTLRASNNTRLSPERGSCVRAPDAPETAEILKDGPSPLLGLVPSAAGRNILAFLPPGFGSDVLTDEAAASGTGAGRLRSDLLSVSQVNAYIPCQVSNAGAIPAVTSYFPPSSCRVASTGGVWTAFVGLDPATSTLFLYVTVSGADGELQASATPLVSYGATDPWAAITAHGSTVKLWWRDTNDLKIATVSLSGNGLTLGTPATVVAGLDWAISPSVVSGEYEEFDGTVDATYAAFAYVTCINVADGEVHKVTVATGALADTETFAGVMTSASDMAICFGKQGASLVVGVVYSADLSLSAYVLDPGTLAAVDSDNIVASSGTAAVQFYTAAGVSGLMVAVSELSSSFDAGYGSGGTRIYALASGTLAQTYAMPWVRLYSRGAALKLTSTDTYPLFDTTHAYAATAVSPSSANYVLDPAITVYTGIPTAFSPVARFACMRSNLSPVHTDPTLPLMNSAVVAGRKVRFNWLKDILDSSVNSAEVPGDSAQPDYPARFTELDFSAAQPTVVHDKSGLALVAAALPVQWDGSELVEVGGPIHAPKLDVDNTGGTGPTLAAGDYRFGVHFEWTSTSGLTHRSAPAIVNWTSAGSKPILRCTSPDGLKDGVGRSQARAVFYATATDGATLHRLTGDQAITAGVISMTDVPAADAARQIIYTTGVSGQAQPPQPPPPTLDWAIVGNRIIGIDAEVPDRLFHSKRRVAGAGFEFSPFYEIVLPAGAGKATAVREWQGTAVIFTERGIYQVGGDGPDNLVGNPSGGSFSAPIKVGSVGCTNRKSIVVTPKGIMFQRDQDILAFAGGEPALVAGVQFSTDVTGACLLADKDEAVFYAGATAKTYNYLLGRWTLWANTGADAISFVQSLPWSTAQVVLATADDNPVIRLLDSSNASQSAEMSWETDWLVLGGDFEDRVVVQWAQFTARRLSEHGVRIEVFTNYDETASANTTDQAWSAAEITALGARYTLRKTLRRQDTRAVKVRITETNVGATRTGMRPICLTLFYRVEAISNESAMVQGSCK